MSIIDSMTNGYLFNDDQAIYDKLLKVIHWNPLLVGAKKLNENYKKIIVKLINNELEIEKYKNLNEYVYNLFK